MGGCLLPRLAVDGAPDVSRRARMKEIEPTAQDPELVVEDYFAGRIYARLPACVRTHLCPVVSVLLCESVMEASPRTNAIESDRRDQLMFSSQGMFFFWSVAAALPPITSL